MSILADLCSREGDTHEFYDPDFPEYDFVARLEDGIRWGVILGRVDEGGSRWCSFFALDCLSHDRPYTFPVAAPR